MNLGPAPYTDEQWAEIVHNRPLEPIDDEGLGLLHRHWLWANHAHRWFDRGFQARPEDAPTGPEQMHEEWAAAMYVWYALLWTVIDGMTERRARLQGALRDDARRGRESLHEARNAVFHVGAEYYDERLFKPMWIPESALIIHRLHHGIGNLLLDEMQKRRRKE